MAHPITLYVTDTRIIIKADIKNLTISKRKVLYLTRKNKVCIFFIDFMNNNITFKHLTIF